MCVCQIMKVYVEVVGIHKVGCLDGLSVAMLENSERVS